MTDPTPAPTTAEFTVEGMHCGSCVALIEEVLGDTDGVTSAAVDLDAARAVVGYDPARIRAEQLAAVITDVGYAATPVG